MDPAELAFAGVATLARLLRARQISALELAEASLGRIDAIGARLGCFARVSAERARADARAADAELAAGRSRSPLHGIPYGLVDVIDTRGIATALGIAELGGRVPDRDATVAARLADSGAVLVGKLAVLPLAGAGAHAPAATCRTPWDAGRGAGGPSPGPAAAVAAGLVPFALAVEGSAPSTAPAACGVTALRPTYGVLPRHGVIAGSYTLGAVGPVARSAADCATVLDALAGADPRDRSSISPPRGLARVSAEIAPGLRVGVVEEPAAAPDERDAWEAAQELLRAAGAIVAPAEVPGIPWEAVAALIGAAEAAVIGEDVVRVPGVHGQAVVGTAADLVRAERVRAEAQGALARMFERHDLLLSPAPRGGAPEGDRLSSAIALGGLPALSLPIGLAGTRPLGARLVAPPLEEGRLLSAGSLFQSRSSHHLQRPPLGAAATPVAAVTRR